MVATRKTLTTPVSKRLTPSPMLSNGNSSLVKNLRKGDLGGAIFGCKDTTKDECLAKQLFGLPSFQFTWIKNIEPGLPLFLFNFTDKKLHGVYEAASPGQMNIDPYAWTEEGKERTSFPAQVRIRIKRHCNPLNRQQYYEVIKDNYYCSNHFWFELDHAQTEGLLALFKPSSADRIPLAPASLLPTTNFVPKLPATQWTATSNSMMSAGGSEKNWNASPSFCREHKNKFALVCWDGREKEPTEEVAFRESVSDRDTDGEGQMWNNSCIKMTNAVAEAREARELVADLEADWAEEAVQSNHLTANSYQDGESQRIRGAVNETPVNATEELLGSSGDGPHMGEGGQTLVKHQSNGDSFETVLQRLKYLQMGRESLSSMGCIDDSNIHRDMHNESLSRTEISALVEEKTTTPDPITEFHNETELSKTSFTLAKEYDNPMSSGLCHGNAELVQTVRELKEKTVTLEKKQLNSDLEIQNLRNVVMESGKLVEDLKCHIKELESKLSHVLFSDSEKVIYLIGGFNGTTWLSALDSFLPSVDMIKPLKSMSCARSYASAAALNGKLYVFGGGDGSSWFDSVECYSPKEDEWTMCPSLIRPKGSLAGATSSGKIFAIGGGDGYECFSDVEMLDPSLGKWINVQQMLEKRFAPAAAELHGVLYAVGGYDGKCYLQSVERYDPRDAYWTRLPNMRTRRGCHTLSVFNEKLYAVGGYDGEKIVSSVEVFDPRVGMWMMDEPLTSPRGYSATAVLDDSLYIIGGVKDGDNIMNSVECYKEGSGWAVTGSKAVGTRSFLSAIVL